jgi:hypothetical protein
LSILRNDEEKKKYVNNIINSIKSTLFDKDSDDAIKYVDWMYTKLKDSDNNIKEVSFNKELRKLKPKTDVESLKRKRNIKKKRSKILPINYPKGLQIGDIVIAKFGSGYCNELNNEHYVIILSNIVGSMYLVAPLTSVKPVAGEILYYDDLRLPSNDTSIDKSYVLFNQIRFVHFRRLENIRHVGRRHVNYIRVKDILDKFNSVIAP